jgi:pimeloyl-ACP methyl ester carboxylesterase/predicted glycosyltransferase
MRSVQPDSTGYAVRDAVKISYEVFGRQEPAILLLPTWGIIHSRFWKGQVGYLSRHHRVITFDGRGSGQSSAPADPEGYAHGEFAADALAVLDATGTERAVVVGSSAGVLWGIELTADHPDRVLGLVCMGTSFDLDEPAPDPQAFHRQLTSHEGWDKFNAEYLLGGGYDDFLGWFFPLACSEPHSSKAIEDGIGWAHDTTPEALIASQRGMVPYPPSRLRELAGRISRPVLVIHGEDDLIEPHSRGVALARVTGGSLLSLGGAGHASTRHPVKVNQVLHDFAGSVAPVAPTTRRWTRALNRPKRVLYVSSPVGLGHARRDLAIAAELRAIHPGLEIDWLAQPPVTAVLTDEAERVHPASRFLSSEVAHIEDECAEHDLHAFQAMRRMDEILVHNFMVFSDVVGDEPYDLVIGDEAWDIDFFWHENPERKTTSFAWMTDFVGWLPMPDGGERERLLAADYNLEMIEQRARFKRIRDRSIFVGNPDDIVPDSFGPGLPGIRDWTAANFDFSGYITGFDPITSGQRDQVRAELGFDDRPVCLVTVGGTGVGTALLDKVVAAFPQAAAAVPGLRMIVVTGPRIDPRTIERRPGLEIHGYLPRLYRWLAACDLAVVQGGLTTCMELTANRRPFLYFPLGHHFEQNYHVAHRLDRYGAGRRMDFRTTTPTDIAEAIATDIHADVTYRPVETVGAARAAHLLGELL